MKEVRSVLHVIFRCLLKRLDETELRRRGSLGQGKTCRLIHISNFADRFQRALWMTGNRWSLPEQVHSLSTSTGKIGCRQGFGIIFRFGLSPEFRRNWENRCDVFCRHATNGIGGGWILILDRHRL
ncbi:hypothetical protein EFR84_00300 [Rhizobium chutanense]|uniref:Uncharacterized protein n=1 Tax=Rhizobium chutanense TaxID=2035448 RepID=A0A432P9A2_9HYPH|nr:hypothetical protein EFR84_00300 [Rhizobium chutanense]